MSAAAVRRVDSRRSQLSNIAGPFRTVSSVGASDSSRAPGQRVSSLDSWGPHSAQNTRLPSALVGL